MTEPRWAVFISGTGSNLKTFIESANVRLVVSSSESAVGISKSYRNGVPVRVTGAKINWDHVQNWLSEFKIDSIILLGFMRIVPSRFLSQWQGRILNLHPSLLPMYPGLNSIEKAFHDGQPLGVTLHNVIPAVDAGDIIMQKKSIAAQNRSEAALFTHACENRVVDCVASRTLFNSHKGAV